MSLCIARDPSIRISELADGAGIGERAAQKIIADLVADGYISRTRNGRRNDYTLNRDTQIRHLLFSDLPIGALIDALIDKPSSAT